MNSQNQDLILFKTDDHLIQVSVKIEKETLWLNLNQIAELFERDKSVISKHMKNIFKEGELEEISVVANFATTASDGKTYNVDFYNLDAIISVGYRVNSRMGTQFRKWASSVLKDYVMPGHALNNDNLYKKGFEDLKRSIKILTNTLINQSLVQDVGETALGIIEKYATTWKILLAYDEDRLTIKTDREEGDFPLSYDAIIESIDLFKKTLIEKGEGTNLFGQQKDDHLSAIFESVHQTFDKNPLYPSFVERASHLLYFVIKDHPFVDGNKRIASFLFVLYLKTHKGTLLDINTKTLVALALLIAESEPSDKELMIKLISNLIENGA
jgi:prophage maintenance system killer protein